MQTPETLSSSGRHRQEKIPRSSSSGRESQETPARRQNRFPVAEFFLGKVTESLQTFIRHMPLSLKGFSSKLKFYPHIYFSIPYTELYIAVV